MASSSSTGSARERKRLRELALKVDKVSRFLVPAAFFMLNVGYWAVYG